VFGRAAAQRAAKIVDKEASHKKLKEGTLSKLIDRLDKVRNAKGKTSVADLRLKMQRAMQNHAAVFRTEETLVEGQKMIDAIRKE
jgi:succinate dehydrogenase / fumarate reductase flavoprotein subunit